jgi:hypothetical protein
VFLSEDLELEFSCTSNNPHSKTRISLASIKIQVN